MIATIDASTAYELLTSSTGIINHTTLTVAICCALSCTVNSETNPYALVVCDNRSISQEGEVLPGQFR